MLSKKLIIATLFAMLMAAGGVQAGGDAARGQELSEDCAGCHGDDGKGDDETPALAGMDKAAHVSALKGYASGEREDESGMMADYAVDLSEQDMADLAAYYATLK
jgi:cytochrome c553